MKTSLVVRSVVAVGLIACVGCVKEEASTIAKPTAPVVPKAVNRARFPDVRFVEITKDAGLTFKHQNAARGDKYLPETIGSGAAFFDADGDGDPDLFLVNSTHWDDAPASTDPKPSHAFYRNDGKGHFADATEEAGLGHTAFGMGVAVGDYDNDGDPDLLVTALGGNALFQNDGKGHFIDVTEQTGVRGSSTGWCTSASFFDMDRDGDLDLFCCGYVNWSKVADDSISSQLSGTDKGKAYDPPTGYKGSQCLLFRNDGGKFVDVSESSGIQVFSPDGKASVAKSLGVAPWDVDGDGWVDLAVANDTVVNFFFHNLGGGKFEEIGLTTGIAFDQMGSTRAAMGIDWADFKNDGTLGLAIGNFANEMTALYVTEDPKSLQFSDLANIYGLGAPTPAPAQVRPVLLRLRPRRPARPPFGQRPPRIRYRPDPGFANLRPGGPTVLEHRPTGPRAVRPRRRDSKPGPDLFRPIVGRGSTYADIDGDGDLDVLLTANGGVPHLFRNDGGNKNHWLRLDLHGSKLNRDAQGAKVEVTVGGVTNRRQLFTTKGYLSSVEHPLTFGLGAGEVAEKVSIIWPSGVKTELSNLKANRTVRLVEGENLMEK